MKKTLFETERLWIRPYCKADADAVWHVLRRPEIYDTTAYIQWDYPREKVDWWITFVQNAAQNGMGYEFGLFAKADGHYVGNVGVINVHRENYSGAITYFVRPEDWNKGYATEAAREMLRFAFEALQLHRVSGACMSRNPASRRVMEKMGMTFVGTVEDELYKDGEFIDIDHLSLLRKNWKSI